MCTLDHHYAAAEQSVALPARHSVERGPAQGTHHGKPPGRPDRPVKYLSSKINSGSELYKSMKVEPRYL